MAYGTEKGKHMSGSAFLHPPTRCGLLTGRYQQRAGLERVLLVPRNDKDKEVGLPSEEITFAKVMGDNGYRTALIGKWHLGYLQKHHPMNFGFQKFVGFKSGNVDYQSHRNRYGDMDWWDGLEVKDMPGYTTTLLTTLSEDYIKENKDKPFCLYIAHAAPHSPMQGPHEKAIRTEATPEGDKNSDRSNKEIYKDMTRFWGKLFAINFAMGVATGITMEFQFGTNWAYYSHYVGDIFGAPLAIEALVAFFMESTFAGLFFFGWKRLSRLGHWVCTFLMALGTNISAMWILIANGWMQFPKGSVFNVETMRMEMDSFWTIISSEWAQATFTHTVSAGYMTGAVFVMAISAWYLLRKRDVEFAKKSLMIACAFGLVTSLFTIHIRMRWQRKWYPARS